MPLNTAFFKRAPESAMYLDSLESTHNFHYFDNDQYAYKKSIMAQEYNDILGLSPN